MYFPNAKTIKKYFYYKKSLNINNEYLVKQPHPSCLGTYSYLINKKCCDKIINEININKIRFPIDFEYHWIFYKLNLNSYYNKNDVLINHANFETTVRI